MLRMREKMRGLAAILEVHRGLVPIHLRLHAPVVTLRHERLARRHSQLLLAPPHVAPHRRFRHARLGMLLANPLPDPVRRVPLLARRFPIALQNPVNELAHRPQLRTAPAPVSCAPAESRWPAPAAPSADAYSTSSPLPGSCPLQTDTPDESPRIVPLCVSCPSAPRRFRRQVRPSVMYRVGQIKCAKWANSE